MRRTIEAPAKVTQEINIDFEQINHQEPVIRQEDLYGKGIGRFTTDLKPLHSWSSSATFDNFFNLLNVPKKELSQKTAYEKLARDMHNNNDEKLIRIPEHTRAVSVFYTLDPRNSLFMLEWGKIDPDSKESKLHTSIRNAVDYNQRVKEKMHIFSGHMAPLTNTPHYFSLIDSVSSLPTHKMSAEEKILIDMLYNINFIPLTTDGQIVLPQFVQPK